MRIIVILVSSIVCPVAALGGGIITNPENESPLLITGGSQTAGAVRQAGRDSPLSTLVFHSKDQNGLSRISFEFIEYENTPLAIWALSKELLKTDRPELRVGIRGELILFRQNLSLSREWLFRGIQLIAEHPESLPLDILGKPRISIEPQTVIEFTFSPEFGLKPSAEQYSAVLIRLNTLLTMNLRLTDLTTQLERLLAADAQQVACPRVAAPVIYESAERLLKNARASLCEASLL